MNRANVSILQGGKYQIIDLLGSGGFGNTYLAIQVALGRKVAIKEFYMQEFCSRDKSTTNVLIPTESNREIFNAYRKKFIKEAQMIASLNNEHIIKIYDIFAENNTAYYVMEYIEGGSLDDMVECEGRLPMHKAIRYVRQIAYALSYLHSNNILHLDVKPANILLDKYDRPILIDFGISKHYGVGGGQTSMTPAGISKGFAPLEQYQQSSIANFSPATDIYSLGATLYYLLSGQIPPEATEIYEQGLPRIDCLKDEMIFSALARTMSPRRKDRPQSVGDFLSILDVHKEESVTINDIHKRKVKKPLQKQKRNRSVIIGIIAGVSVAVIVALLFLKTPLFYMEPSVDERQNDVLLINGDKACHESFSASGEKKQYSLTKNFKEGCVCSDIPEWCSVYLDSSVVAITCSKNTSSQGRTAVLHISKYGTAVPLAKITIDQSGTHSVKPDGLSSQMETHPAKVVASSIILPPTALLEGNVGECLSLDYDISPVAAAEHDVQWSSSDEEVATVEPDGTVTAKGNGKATITASVDGVSSECQVEVRILFAEMSISDYELTLQVGQSHTISAYNYGKSIQWKSDNPQVATVSSTGKVSAVGEGNANIWAKGVSYKCCYVKVLPSHNVRVPQMSDTSSTASSLPTSPRIGYPGNIYLAKGETINLRVPGYNVIRWESENPKIVSVSSSGVARGERTGKTNLWGHVGASPRLFVCYVE